MVKESIFMSSYLHTAPVSVTRHTMHRNLCRQCPIVGENHHTETEGRYNRDSHHPTEISTPTPSS